MDLVTPETETTIVDVWYTPISIEHWDALEARYLPELTAEERERHDRFHFRKDRILYLAAKALARLTIPRYARSETSAEDIRFDAHPGGKPFISGPAQAQKVQFNLTHTDGMVACAISPEFEVGVDVEDIYRKSATDEIAERFFAAPEVQEFKNLPEKSRFIRFFQYWTLKEAYIKGRGLGLRIPLGDFSMSWKNEEISITYHAEGPHTQENWQFQQWEVGLGHMIAAAVRVERPVQVKFLLHEVVLAR